MESSQICLSRRHCAQILRDSGSLAYSPLIEFDQPPFAPGKGHLDCQLLSPLQFSFENSLEEDRDSLLRQNFQPSSYLPEDTLFGFLQLQKRQSSAWESNQELPSCELANSTLQNNSDTLLDSFPSEALPMRSDAATDRGTTDRGVLEESAKRRKVSTKNITKNMSKLLLKWIWKNRSQLRISLQYQLPEWEDFISRIKIWKRLNNLTRYFLATRWHSEGEESRLFRVLSLHFFRRYCRQFILDSNIEDKSMHVQKIPKFIQGVSSPEGLDSLS